MKILLTLLRFSRDLSFTRFDNKCGLNFPLKFVQGTGPYFEWDYCLTTQGLLI
jgi:hypothetical protein